MVIYMYSLCDSVSVVLWTGRQILSDKKIVNRNLIICGFVRCLILLIAVARVAPSVAVATRSPERADPTPSHECSLVDQFKNCGGHNMQQSWGK
jgi:hypothetical protein